MSGCIQSPCLFNLHAVYIMWNAVLNELQAGIKIAGRNINSLRYAKRRKWRTKDPLDEGERREWKKLAQNSTFKKLRSWHLGPTVQFSSVAQSCPTLCDPMNCSTPGLPVHHQLPESTQTHVHRVGDAIQPFHPLSSPSPLALNLSQHQGLF